MTRDVDVVAFVDGSVLSSGRRPSLERHVRAVALEIGLAPNWMNLGPMSLLDVGLPDGFLARCRIEEFDGLTLHVAGRYDLIHMKLYAAADQGPKSKHMADLIALDPTSDELLAAGAWCRTHDVSAPFAAELDAAVAWVERSQDD